MSPAPLTPLRVALMAIVAALFYIFLSPVDASLSRSFTLLSRYGWAPPSLPSQSRQMKYEKERTKGNMHGNKGKVCSAYHSLFPQPLSKGVVVTTFVSPKKVRTASIALSSLNTFLAEGGLGWFHPHAFSISFHAFLLRKAQALRLATRWYRDYRSPLSHQQHSLVSTLRPSRRGKSDCSMPRQELVLSSGRGLSLTPQLLSAPLASEGVVSTLAFDATSRSASPCRSPWPLRYLWTRKPRSSGGVCSSALNRRGS